ncbi:unnamed protein product [Effrenium voratum]|nr:unnamed protein product [Effrenium voratum]
MRPSWRATAVLAACQLLAAAASPRKALEWKDNLAHEQATKGFLGVKNPEMPDADWEADLVKDDSDDGKWAAQMDYEVPQKTHGDLEKEVKQALEAAKVAENAYEESQKKELRLRDKMVQATAMAKKKSDEIASLESQLVWQEESIQWVKEDIKYGESQVKKYKKAIKELEAEIKSKQARIRAISGTNSTNMAKEGQAEMEEMVSRSKKLRAVLAKRQAALKATQRREEELQAEEKSARSGLTAEARLVEGESPTQASVWSRLRHFAWY